METEESVTKKKINWAQLEFWKQPTANDCQMDEVQMPIPAALAILKYSRVKITWCNLLAEEQVAMFKVKKQTVTR